MNKKLKSFIAVTFLLGLRVAANAEIRDQVLVKLPFEFVVSGTTLPAGTYTVKRRVQQQSNLLLLTNNDNRRSILVHPSRGSTRRMTSPKYVSGRSENSAF
jgi:hypothetical protein